MTASTIFPPELTLVELAAEAKQLRADLLVVVDRMAQELKLQYTNQPIQALRQEVIKQLDDPILRAIARASHE